jgi:hypothetical protein
MEQAQKHNAGRLKRRAMIGAAVMAILGGGVIVAVPAATGNSHARGHARHRSATVRAAHRGGHGVLATAASYLGLSTAQLRSELQSGKTLAQIADATSGKSAVGLVDALVSAKAAKLAASEQLTQQAKLAKARTQATARVDAKAGSTPAGSTLSAASSYLGVSAAQLHSDLRSGQTLAQLARATAGKSAAGLIDALTNARKSKLAAEVASGALTQQNEQKRLAVLHRRVAHVVTRKHHKGAAARG